MSDAERPVDFDEERPADPEEEDLVELPSQVGRIPPEADEADALDQALEVPLDQDGDQA